MFGLWRRRLVVVRAVGEVPIIVRAMRAQPVVVRAVGEVARRRMGCGGGGPLSS